jgi:hypothetical protein
MGVGVQVPPPTRTGARSTECRSALRLLSVALPRPITVGDDVAKASLVDVFGPLERFFCVASDAVEEGAEHLGGAQAHVLVGLVDEESLLRASWFTGWCRFSQSGV